jgi:pyruvate/2-oxoglutarate dehydrogenase complex dihydrolipoamide acyltransferase (E2) component
MKRVTVPFLDVNILDVTITAWLKEPGERVAQGECIAELTTDKASFELESPVAGVLIGVYAPVRSIVPINYILALIGDEGDSDPAIEGDNEKIMAEYRSQTATEKISPPAKSIIDTRHLSPQPTGQNVRATPKARRLAQANSIDLSDVQRDTGATMITETILNTYIANKDE